MALSAIDAVMLKERSKGNAARSPATSHEERALCYHFRVDMTDAREYRLAGNKALTNKSRYKEAGNTGACPTRVVSK